MSMNRGSALLAMIQQEFPEYHPLVSIARIAHDERASLNLQFECHKTISRFVEPELKSIEVHQEKPNKTVTVTLFDLSPDDYEVLPEPETHTVPGLLPMRTVND